MSKTENGLVRGRQPSNSLCTSSHRLTGGPGRKEGRTAHDSAAASSTALGTILLRETLKKRASDVPVYGCALNLTTRTQPGSQRSL